MLLIPLFLLILVCKQVRMGPACRISEYPCRNGHCVRLNSYCDGRNDCGDMSDEPLYCTVCNRTYYGDISNTYELRVPRISNLRLPFLCHLTFTANGQNHGDIVQLVFDEFQVGRYESTTTDGCPDGYMQLSELGRPFTGGSWCGTSTGPALYYSETSTVTVTVKLFASPHIPFRFAIRYRFVTRREAIVRFGTPQRQFERGQIQPGTYCTRQFEECYRKRCRLQSPNYPGMYPRNVSCFWSLRQKFVPTCKHAMIAVGQDSAHKIHMKRSVSTNRTRALKVWHDCTGDHLVFYDGTSVADPILAKYCGGDWLPRVVSHGPEMLVAFHSSPFSVPLRASPSLHGFELDVDVIFADSDSLDYARDARRCEFTINATDPDGDEVWTGRGRRGRLSSPKHSLPPNTTCTYRFRGHRDDLVWISFVSYGQRTLFTTSLNGSSGSGCASRLRVWDGTLLLEDKCDEAPKLCDHGALSNATRRTRPCDSDESYLSSGKSLVVQHHTEDGTALYPVSFRLLYEFVDTRLGGEGEGDGCNRVFGREHIGEVLAPRNVFLYGRGGAHDLHCVYRLEAGEGERIRLVLNNASFGATPACETLADPHSGRPYCEYYPGARSAELSVWEVPWRDVHVPRACLCDNSTFTGRPLVFLSASRILELRFVVREMHVDDDFGVLHFHATFELIKMAECGRRQRMRGSGGEIRFGTPPIERADVLCAGMPWLLESRNNRSLFLLGWGVLLPLRPRPDEPARCPTTNRLLVYSGRPLDLVKVVCPAEPGDPRLPVRIFSEEWWSDAWSSVRQRPPHFLVEWIGNEPGVSALSWLEIARSRSSLLTQLKVPFNATQTNETNEYGECRHKCPELDACIGSELWCDGRRHCPSGWDESELQCGAAATKLLTALPGAALAAAAAVLSTGALLACFAIHRLRTRRRRRRLAKKKLLTGPRLFDDGSLDS